MVRKRIGNNVTGGNRGHPNIAYTAEVNSGGNRAIPLGPSKARRVGVKVPPDINDTASVKQGRQVNRALTTGIKWIRATTIL